MHILEHFVNHNIDCPVCSKKTLIVLYVTFYNSFFNQDPFVGHSEFPTLYPLEAMLQSWKHHKLVDNVA
jgi:hypothetical protein